MNLKLPAPLAPSWLGDGRSCEGSSSEQGHDIRHWHARVMRPGKARAIAPGHESTRTHLAGLVGGRPSDIYRAGASLWALLRQELPQLFDYTHLHLGGSSEIYCCWICIRGLQGPGRKMRQCFREVERALTRCVGTAWGIWAKRCRSHHAHSLPNRVMTTAGSPSEQAVKLIRQENGRSPAALSTHWGTSQTGTSPAPSARTTDTAQTCCSAGGSWCLWWPPGAEKLGCC